MTASEKLRALRSGVHEAANGRTLDDKPLLRSWQRPYPEDIVTFANALPAIIAVVEADEGLIRVAEGLFQMIPDQVWRDSGGDDGQGHYEGEYRAAQIREGFEKHRAALATLSQALEPGEAENDIERLESSPGVC